MCLEKTALMLKNSYWNLVFVDNPFIFLPSSIVDSLIVQVTRMSLSLPLECTDLSLLLMSGRVRNFVLEDVLVDSDTLEDIFMCLTGSCQNLIKIKLKNVYCNASRKVDPNRRKQALNSLLSMALNLKYVESCLEFDLCTLQNCIFLEKLVINFPFKGDLFDMLPVDMVPSTSLKYLEVYEDVRHPLSFLDVATILKFCSELVDINCDVSKSLEYLHSEEYYDGTLTTKYKLERCYLGNIFLQEEQAPVSRDEVYIATLTCPNLKDISVLVNDDRAVYALSDFEHVTTLLLQWESLQGGDYTFGVQALLEKPEFGANLTCLHLIHFSSIDFSSIGMCCPNVEVLRVEYLSESNRNRFLSTSFQKLGNLHLENIDDGDCQVSTLVGILSYATNLKYLTVQSAGSLRDQVLAEILEKNSLSKLKEFRLSNCILSFHGIRNLASNLSCLEYLELSTTEINLDEAAAAIHEINPQVILSSTVA